MKDMAIHTRLNPKERIKKLTNFANRLLSTPDVNYLYYMLFHNLLAIYHKLFIWLFFLFFYFEFIFILVC